MFVRNSWKVRTEEELWEFVDNYSWALLVNNGDAGPYATNLPLMLDRSGGASVLVGHIAEGNEHARALRAAASPTLAVFQGPVSYVTASWYPGRDMPPTYYYTFVRVACAFLRRWGDSQPRPHLTPCPADRHHITIGSYLLAKMAYYAALPSAAIRESPNATAIPDSPR